MLKMPILLFVSAILSLSLVAQNPKRAKDENAIRDADKEWSQAVGAKDLDKTTSFYATDASVLPFNGPLSTGREPIRQLWSHLFDMPGFHLQFAPTKIEISKSGDMAYDLGTFELRTNGSDGSPATTQGKYVVVWKKEGGQWKAVADIFNTDK
jgi:ketosteroid isomerase-like protein